MTDPNRFFPQLTAITAFKSQTLKLPDAFYKAQLALADAEQAIVEVKRRAGEAKGELADLENEVALEVAGEKVLFTNEATRKAETRRRFQASDKYKALTAALATIEAQQFQAEHTRTRAAIEVKRIEFEERALRMHTDLTGAEVQLLVAGR